MRRSKMKALLAAGAAIAGAASLLACSAVLGFDTFGLDPGAGNGGEAGADGASNDGPTSEDGGETCANADLLTSRTHCGRCDHPCGAGACEDGTCKAHLLLDGLTGPQGIVASSAHVFVAEYYADRILKLKKDGTSDCASGDGCIFVENDDAIRPTALGIDAERVFYATTGVIGPHTIRYCPIDGCDTGAGKVVLATMSTPAMFYERSDTQRLPLELRVHDGSVFWPEAIGGQIRSVRIDAPEEITTHLADRGGSNTPVAIAVDTTRIYFTDDRNADIRSVRRAKIVDAGFDANPGPEDLRSDVASLAAWTWSIQLAKDSSLVWTHQNYETNVANGTVRRAPRDFDGGLSTSAFTTTGADPGQVVVDDVNAYWVNGGFRENEGDVVYCPLDGCPGSGPIVLARKQNFPRHIAVDEHFVYWTNHGTSATGDNGNLNADGSVWMIAKP